MYTERIAIREEININREEMWRLRERNQHLMSRLRELDDFERESIDVEGILHTMMSTVKELTKLFPHIPADIILNHMAKMNGSDNIINEEINKNDEIERKVASTAEVADQQKNDSVIKRNNAGHDLSKVSAIVASFLKETGVPTKSKKIFEYLEKNHNLKWIPKSQGGTISGIMKHEKHVQKVSGMAGYYQYKF